MLENQIKENQQSITEQLQKYGVGIPEEETEKMFFLVDVSRGAHCRVTPWTHVSLFCPPSTRKGAPGWRAWAGRVGCGGRRVTWLLDSSSRGAPRTLKALREASRGVWCPFPKVARRQQERLAPPQRAHTISRSLDAGIGPSSARVSSPQKINIFNQDIRELIEGEEAVGGNESRLFTKIRLEFGKWSMEIEDSFQRGESEPPTPPPRPPCHTHSFITPSNALPPKHCHVLRH